MSTKIAGPLDVRSTAGLAGMWAAWKAARAAQRDTIDQMIPLCQPERTGGRDE